MRTRYLLALITFLAVPLSSFAASSALRTLDAANCAAAGSSPIAATLPESWAEYKAYAKICPLAKSARSTARVYLVSIFAKDFYAAHPSEKAWRPFPLPLIVDAKGKCLARLPEVFPFDEPRTLTMKFGKWDHDVPARILVSVSNPAVGGDYALPLLSWNASRAAYESHHDTNEHKASETSCPALP